MKLIFTIYLRAAREFARHDGPVMSGHLAFLTMLGMFPFLIFFVSLAAFFGQSQAGIEVIGFLFDQMPQDIQDVLYGPVNKLMNDTNRGILTTSILGAIWVSSSTIDAARVAIQRAHGVSDGPVFWRRRLEGIVMVVLAASAILTGMAIYVLGPAAWKAVNAFIPLSGAWTSYMGWARLGASFLLMFSALCALMFVLRPSGYRRSSPVTPGALTTLVLWMGIGAVFSSYLKQFGQYDNTYGSLAGPIIALLFFYLVNACFLFGAEVNSTISWLRKQKETAADQSDQLSQNDNS